MFQRIYIKIVIWLLSKVILSKESRLLLTSSILENLDAIPFYDIIKYDTDGSLLINNRNVDLETARMLRESATGALNNKALILIKESVMFQAFSYSATKADSPESLLFGKAAIWWGQQEDRILGLLAQVDKNLGDLTP